LKLCIVIAIKYVNVEITTILIACKNMCSFFYVCASIQLLCYFTIGKMMTLLQNYPSHPAI